MTTKEVMARLGHSSPAAAQRYQHAAERRDAVIASALDIVLGALPRFKNDAPTNETKDALWGWVGLAIKRPSPPNPTPGLTRDFGGASDGNRTRVLSLGNWWWQVPGHDRSGMWAFDMVICSHLVPRPANPGRTVVTQI